MTHPKFHTSAFSPVSIIWENCFGMFPKIMNDENFSKKAAAHGEEPPLTPQNEHQWSGLRLRPSRQTTPVRLARLACSYRLLQRWFPHPPPGWWWLVLVGWAFVWPHLAWQIASRAVDPLSRGNLQLKNRCSISGNVGRRNGRKRAAFHRYVDDCV